MFSLFIHIVHRVLIHSNVLCFTDGIELNMRDSSDDCKLLQANLDRFVDWFTALGLFLYLSRGKCEVFTLPRIQSPIA